MVPTLFPFMMISSIMVYSGADLELGRMLSHVLRKIYRYSSYGLYAIFMGFFCGFPMGAKVVSDLYDKEKISKSEAEALLAFCNNIGPAYFMGIIMPLLRACGYHNTLPFVFGMYGIPAIYGIVIGRFHAARTEMTGVTMKSSRGEEHSLAATLKKSCVDNTQSLIVLGGYITFANAFRIFLDFMPLSGNCKIFCQAFWKSLAAFRRFTQLRFCQTRRYSG